MKISNVIEDNMNLKQELKEAFQEVNRLIVQVKELTDRIIELEDQAKSLKSSGAKQSTSVPTPSDEMSIFE